MRLLNLAATCLLEMMGTMVSWLPANAKAVETDDLIVCLPLQLKYCIPREYEAFYDFTYFQTRPAGSVNRDGPVLITVHTGDNFALESLDDFSLRRVGDFDVLYDYRCPTRIHCTFRFGESVSREGRSVVGIIRSVEITGRTEGEMAQALAKLRYCVAGARDCPTARSVSFAALRSG